MFFCHSSLLYNICYTSYNDELRIHQPLYKHIIIGRKFLNLQYVTLFSRWAIDAVVLYCNSVLLGVLLCTVFALEMLNDRGNRRRRTVL